jgi:hypothetical protein
MIDKEKIPEPTYNELVDLFGIEEAEKIIIDKQYNFRAISLTIIEEKTVRFLGIQSFRLWLKNNLGLTLKALLIILILLGFIFIILQR